MRLFLVLEILSALKQKPSLPFILYSRKQDIHSPSWDAGYFWLLYPLNVGQDEFYYLALSHSHQCLFVNSLVLVDRQHYLFSIVLLIKHLLADICSCYLLLDMSATGMQTEVLLCSNRLIHSSVVDKLYQSIIHYKGEVVRGSSAPGFGHHRLLFFLDTR